MAINVSRTKCDKLGLKNVSSIGASYTHIKTLANAISKNTKKIVMYHSMLTSLEGLENSEGIEVCFLGFNRIKNFRDSDINIKKIGVLDLVGNPITSLKGCPPCDVLIISSTLITDLEGCPEGVTIIRCGHSTHLTSLRGCPQSVKIIECSCSPNLNIEKQHLPTNLEQLLRD